MKKVLIEIGESPQTFKVTQSDINKQYVKVPIRGLVRSL